MKPGNPRMERGSGGREGGKKGEREWEAGWEAGARAKPVNQLVIHTSTQNMATTISTTFWGKESVPDSLVSMMF